MNASASPTLMLVTACPASRPSMDVWLVTMPHFASNVLPTHISSTEAAYVPLANIFRITVWPVTPVSASSAKLPILLMEEYAPLVLLSALPVLQHQPRAVVVTWDSISQQQPVFHVSIIACNAVTHQLAIAVSLDSILVDLHVSHVMRHVPFVIHRHQTVTLVMLDTTWVVFRVFPVLMNA